MGDVDDGLDIYVDQLRHLPDNCSLVKMVVRVITDTAEDLIEPKAYWSDISEEDNMMQTFDKVKVEVRGIQINPTAMIHITLGTIETNSGREVILGFVVFPLFIDLTTNMPVVNSRRLAKRELNKTLRTLHSGSYQMPVYC